MGVDVETHLACKLGLHVTRTSDGGIIVPRQVLPGPWLRTVVGVARALAALTSPASAQPAGAARGRVVDRQGNTLDVDGAQVIFDFQGAENRRVETMTNSDGEFSQLGLPLGHYMVTAEKEQLGT